MKPAAVTHLLDWASQSIRRKLVLSLATILTAASLCLLLLIVTVHRSRLLDERSAASVEINHLLQVALENAMLKRDIDGLAGIVRQLGRQERVTGVMILAPDGEVRFASEQANIGRRIDLAAGQLCPGCTKPSDDTKTFAAFTTAAPGLEVLRSINPVPNRDQCTQCHGPVAKNPVNGILVVDYDARQIRRETWMTTAALAAIGLSVLLASIGGIGWTVSRLVLAPVSRLSAATHAISAGRLDERVNFSTRDELGVLGNSFDRMIGRLEQSLRTVEARERYLQALIDAVPDGIRVIDGDYNVINANRAYAARSGLTTAEVMARKCFATSHARETPCAPTMTTCPVAELARKPSPIVFRQRHVTSAGKDTPVEISAAPLELDSADGTRKRLIIEVIRDLGAELKLSQEQRLSELGLLAAGVAHEIHNPLASIQLGLASLTRSLDSPGKSDAFDSIRIIEHEIDRCMEVSSRLLKLSQGPGRRDELVVFNDVIADVLSLLNAEALKLGVEFRLDLAPSLRVLASDSDMRMLTLNLAQNALHAMPRGGTLTVVGRLTGDRVLVMFCDTGVGIAPDDLQRIFDPFWSRRADGVQGTGLGLSICREILNGLGGRISVESTEGKGTTFTISLPSADNEEPVS